MRFDHYMKRYYQMYRELSVKKKKLSKVLSNLLIR